MFRKYSLLLTLLITFIFASVSLQAQEDVLQRLEEEAIMELKVMMPMRDGVRLATDIYRPKTDQPVPIIFYRTPYNFNPWVDGEPQTRMAQEAYAAVKRGYAFVVQNERGRFFSEGNWDILGTPLTDAEDAYKWMRDQSWSNGKIGLTGCSSPAEWQLAAASLDHPADAMVPMGYGAGIGTVGKYHEQGNWFRGGAEQMLFYSWLYGVEQDIFKPRIPKEATQEDLQRISRFYDLSPKNPPVDWAKALTHLPLEDILQNVHGKREIFDKMIRRKPNSKDWFKGGLYQEGMDFNSPSFWFVSWYDVSVSPNIELFNHIHKDNPSSEIRDNQYLVIAPTLHCSYQRATQNTVVGQRSVGDARLNYDEQIYDWFDFLLKGEDTGFKEKTPRVQYYTMGSNQWQSAQEFPPKRAEETTFYLNSENKANSLYGDGILTLDEPTGEGFDEFTYDPMNPVPSHGGNVCCTGNAVQGGAFDQKGLEVREDILVYSTDPLEEGVEVTGFIEPTLYVSSDAKDTDFTVKLIDVYPDGTAYNLHETIMRARYREGYDREVFMENGKVYKLELTPLATSNYFKKGHRIRIEISSSNFPRFARNLNTGGNNYDEKEGVVARNKIHHSAEYPSHIKIPIVRE